MNLRGINCVLDMVLSVICRFLYVLLLGGM